MFHVRKDIYRFFFRLRSTSPLAFGLLVTWLVLEVMFAFVLPKVMSDTRYFTFYVPDKAKESTARFLADKNANIPDAGVGWRNRPNVTLKKWVIDQNGSRSTHYIDMAHKGAKTRVIFFGSSMVNGGEGVNNHQTISAGIESDQVESLNFAAMAFSVDQSLLLYRRMADEVHADYVVVGVDSGPIEGLYNHYVPLRLHDEVGVPYLKPHFKLVDGKLQLIPIKLKWLADLDHPAAFVDFLRQNDGQYYNLKRYEHCDFTPIAHGVCWVQHKIASTLHYLDGKDLATDPLLEAELTTFSKDVEAHNAKLIVMVLPDSRMFRWSGPWKYLPDVYALRVKALQAKGIEALDVRKLLRASGKSAGELFVGDGLHFTAAANKIVAAGLAKLIDQPKS